MDLRETIAIGSALKAIAPAPSTSSQLLANALQLPLNGLTFSAPPGKRTLFGAQSTLRRNVAQDRSQITFSAEKDFINHWIVVHRFTLDRDWTWSGLAQNGPGQTAFSLDGELPDTGPQTLAKIDLPRVVSALATQSNGDPNQRDTPISLDPEPIRTITPDSANDAAGLSAMTQLVASSSSAVHFLVPLPDGIPPAALDRFGFWTYEVRCGHSLWSTAQGRFGRPRVAGVQHPCPPLTLNVDAPTLPGHRPQSRRPQTSPRLSSTAGL